MFPRPSRAALLISAFVVSGCSGGSGVAGSVNPDRVLPATVATPGAASPATPQVFGNTAAARAMNATIPAAQSPASFHVAPMPATGALPSTAMTSLTPQASPMSFRRGKESVSTPSFTQLSGSASEVAGANTGLASGVQLWAASTSPSGANKSLWTYGTGGTWTNISGSASRIAIDPTNSDFYAVNGTSGGLYAYTGFSSANGSGGTWSSLGGGVSDVAVAEDGSVYVLGNATKNGDNAIYQYDGGQFVQIHGSGYRLATAWDGVDYTLPGVGTLTHDGFYVLNAEGNIFYYSPGSGFVQLPGTASAVAPVLGGLFELATGGGAGDSQISYEDYATQINTIEPGMAFALSAVSPQLYAVNAEGAIFVGSADGPVDTNVSTLAGQPGVSSETDGSGSAATFKNTSSIAVGPSGDIYVSGSGSYQSHLRHITPAGQVTTSTATDSSQLIDPTVDKNNNLYVYDNNNQTVDRVVGNSLSLVAGGGSGTDKDGTGSGAGFILGSYYEAMAAGPDGSLYLADLYACSIRKITTPLAYGGGTVTTIAGGNGCGYADGQGTSAMFTSPTGLAVDANSNVYVSDGGRVRKMTSSGLVSTIVGGQVGGYIDGSATGAQLSGGSMAMEPNGNLLVEGPYAIREVTPAGVVSTYAGYANVPGYKNGSGATAEFEEVAGIAVSQSGVVYVVDFGSDTVRVIETSK